MATKNYSTPWPLWRKIVFRILFLFLTFFTVNNLYTSFAFTFLVDLNKMAIENFLTFLNEPFYWLDRHLYHLGYNPETHRNQGADNVFGIIYFMTVFILCVLLSIVWSWLDRKRPSYNRLNYWFKVYLRYAVAIIMLGYGLVKVIPIQMPYPNSLDLLGKVGDQSLFSVLWNFMGASPGYQIFTGICEITASLLLLFRRTSVLGTLLMCAILTNVVALNFFYNVSVKIPSSLLLVCVFYLLTPFLQRFIQLFFYQKEVAFTEPCYQFQSKKIKYLLNVLGVLLISIFIISSSFTNLKWHNKHLTNRGQIYEVASFVTLDSLPPHITDTLNWKRLTLTEYDTTKYAVVYYNNLEVRDWYYYTMDDAKKTFTMRSASGKATPDHVFNYDPAEKNSLSLSGKFKDYEVKINMKPVMDSMLLKKDKIILVQPF